MYSYTSLERKKFMLRCSFKAARMLVDDSSIIGASISFTRSPYSSGMAVSNPWRGYTIMLKSRMISLWLRHLSKFCQLSPPIIR